MVRPVACNLSTLSSREHVHMYLLKVGRWLAEAHPGVESPEQWDQHVAVEYVAAVDRMKTGEWGAWWAHHNPKRAGKPSQPRSKDHQILRCESIVSGPAGVGLDTGALRPGTLPAYPPLHRQPHRPQPQDDRRRGVGEAEDLPRGCPYPVELVRALGPPSGCLAGSVRARSCA